MRRATHALPGTVAVLVAVLLVLIGAPTARGGEGTSHVTVTYTASEACSLRVSNTDLVPSVCDNPHEGEYGGTGVYVHGAQSAYEVSVNATDFVTVREVLMKFAIGCPDTHELAASLVGVAPACKVLAATFLPSVRDWHHEAGIETHKLTHIGTNWTRADFNDTITVAVLDDEAGPRDDLEAYHTAGHVNSTRPAVLFEHDELIATLITVSDTDYVNEAIEGPADGFLDHTAEFREASVDKLNALLQASDDTESYANTTVSFALSCHSVVSPLLNGSCHDYAQDSVTSLARARRFVEYQPGLLTIEVVYDLCDQYDAKADCNAVDGCVWCGAVGLCKNHELGDGASCLTVRTPEAAVPDMHQWWASLIGGVVPIAPLSIVLLYTWVTASKG